MKTPQNPVALRFGTFVANLESGELHNKGAKVKLQEQPFKILVTLLERPGELITRDELRARLWPNETFVDFDHGINVAVAKIREALSDSFEEPQFVETVGRRGYRFIATVAEVLAAKPVFRDTAAALPAPKPSVGRSRERAQLGKAFDFVARGRGMLLCVAGEPGIGKTTLVQDFLSDLQASGRRFNLAIGRCSQRLAGEEAYLPLLEALDNLVRNNDDGTANKLRELAPSWYAQLFPLSENDPSDARLREYVRTATQERVKRELGAFVQEVASREPLVLFFDDIHWTDPSTVDLLAHLATRFENTRVLIVVTYRPSELLLLKHPFVGVQLDLQGRASCQVIDVEFLSADDVQRYLALEFPGNSFPREFASVIHSRTEGNPLFMVDLLRYLRDRQVVVTTEGSERWYLTQSLPDLSRDVPRSVSSVIERKIDQLGDRDREVLTAAAVQGYEFDSAAVAQALATDCMEIEGRLQHLERVNGFVRCIAENEFPDGTLSLRCRFVHVLYQNALDASLAPTRRVALGGALARGLESLYGDKVSGIASQLGFLYETARDPERASNYFLVAAQNAARIFANQETVKLARRGLALLERTAEAPDRTRKELDFRVTLLFSLVFLHGYTAQDVRENIGRARELCQRLGNTPQLFQVLFGFWLYYIGVPELSMARETAEQLLSIARHANDSAQLLLAHVLVGVTQVHQGELVAAHGQLQEALKHHDPSQHMRYLELFRMEVGIYGRSESVRTLWMLGYPDQARRRSEENLALARTLPSPPALGYAFVQAAFLYQGLRQPSVVRRLAEECVVLCDEHGVAQERSWVMFPYGWAVAELGRVEEGVSEIRNALNAQLSQGNEIGHPQYRAFLAEVLAHGGQPDAGLKAVEDGLAISKRNGNVFYDAELLRLRGELFNMQGRTADAECCFLSAIGVARQQGAKSLELRVCASLARLWQKQGKRKEAHRLLRGIYSWFTEGFDTTDLKEAAFLLEELS